MQLVKLWNNFNKNCITLSNSGRFAKVIKLAGKNIAFLIKKKIISISDSDTAMKELQI